MILRYYWGRKFKKKVILPVKLKKDNPALDILRKIWERKRKKWFVSIWSIPNEKYEKVEFDMNTIDSAFMKSKLFKGMEFVFNILILGCNWKTYLPIFINESLLDVYGDNKIKKVKRIKGEQNLGF
jgi:hypothetical protein